MFTLRPEGWWQRGGGLLEEKVLPAEGTSPGGKGGHGSCEMPSGEMVEIRAKAEEGVQLAALPSGRQNHWKCF